MPSQIVALALLLSAAAPAATGDERAAALSPRLNGELRSARALPDLSSAVWPVQDSTVYAATVLRSPRAGTFVLHLGASGATRLWINGKLVHEDPAVHPSRWDQAAFAVELRAGDNSLLLKVAHGIGKPGFSLRVCDGRDEPLPALSRSARPPDGKRALSPVRGAPAAQPPARAPEALGQRREA